MLRVAYSRVLTILLSAVSETAMPRSNLSACSFEHPAKMAPASTPILKAVLAVSIFNSNNLALREILTPG